MTNRFGEMIREWRSIRRYSQLDLALTAALSSRHLSFLESGRAAPSRDMVLRLADALQMPKAVANQALNAAGFVAIYPALPLAAPALEPVRRAIDIMLANHEPFPAIAIDRGWNVVNVNDAAARLFAAIGARAGDANMIEILLGLAETDVIENWPETAVLSLARLRAEIAHLGGDARLEALARRLADHPRLADAPALDYDQPVIPTTFRLGGARLSVFSTIAQFGSVQDVFASELRIEHMFPADEATRAFFEG